MSLPSHSNRPPPPDYIVEWNDPFRQEKLGQPLPLPTFLNDRKPVDMKAFMAEQKAAEKVARKASRKTTSRKNHAS